MRLVYDTSQVKALQRNLKELVETAEKMHRMGVPLNQIFQRLELQMDPVPGGDVGYVPSTIVPLSVEGGAPGELGEEAELTE